MRQASLSNLHLRNRAYVLAAGNRIHPDGDYVHMERKIFWIVFTILGLAADVLLPLWWALAATIPVVWISWWVAYRSDWF